MMLSQQLLIRIANTAHITMVLDNEKYVSLQVQNQTVALSTLIEIQDYMMKIRKVEEYIKTDENEIHIPKESCISAV